MFKAVIPEPVLISVIVEVLGADLSHNSLCKFYF